MATMALMNMLAVTKMGLREDKEIETVITDYLGLIGKMIGKLFGFILEAIKFSFKP